MLVCVMPGDQGRERRSTERCGYIATRENGAPRGESIEVRRLDDGMPHEPVISPGLIIRQDEDDIRRAVLATNARGQQGRAENEQSQEHSQRLYSILHDLSRRELVTFGSICTLLTGRLPRDATAGADPLSQRRRELIDDLRLLRGKIDHFQRVEAQVVQF